jgi:excisionase family DNA binding protein
MSDVQPLALSRRDAAKALGVSLTFFEERIQADLPVVHLGGKVLVPVSELEKWLASHAQTTVPLGTQDKTGRHRRQRPAPDTERLGSGARTA